MSDPAVAEEAGTVAESPPAQPDEATLRRRIEALPDRQRMSVPLYYLDERPVEEVTEMMGMPANTVKTHLHRARAGLAAALGVAQKEMA